MSNTGLPSDLNIRACTEEDILELEKELPSPGTPGFHAIRYANQQDGNSVYLLAWSGCTFLGHLHLRWQGPNSHDVKAALCGCPVLSAIVIMPRYRSQGIGTLLIDTAEKMARERGYTSTCLGVSIENSRAWSLYKRLGYREWEHGTVDKSYTTLDPNGKEICCSERVIYLKKELM